MNDILLSREQAQITVICVKRSRRKRGRRAGCLLRIRRWSNKPPLPSILLANVQSLENKIDDLRRILNYQREIQNCNILCFTEVWLNDDTINIQLAGYTLHRQDRTEAPGNIWCTRSKDIFQMHCTTIRPFCWLCSNILHYNSLTCLKIDPFGGKNYYLF